MRPLTYTKTETTEVVKTLTFELSEDEISKMVEEKLRTSYDYYEMLKGFECDVEFVCGSGPLFDGAIVKFTRKTREETT